MPKITAPLLIAIAVTGLSACGMKGSLEYPPGPPPEPLLGYPKPVKASPPISKKTTPPETPAAEDGSTAKESAR